MGARQVSTFNKKEQNLVRQIMLDLIIVLTVNDGERDSEPDMLLL